VDGDGGWTARRGRFNLLFLVERDGELRITSPDGHQSRDDRTTAVAAAI
jgi:hypothetical protein